VLWQHVVLCEGMLRDITQRSTGRTPAVGHSQQHTLTQYDMMPQHPISTTKLISDYF